MTFGPLTQHILASEMDDFERDQLLNAASPGRQGSQYFTFNVYNVCLDFDSGQASIEDELDAAAAETVPLDEFLAALRGKPHSPGTGP